MEVSIRETVPAIWDVIRYTMVVDDEMYTPVVKSIISALEEKGCSIAKFRNFWSADDYRGINMAFTTAGDDRFELQFHTPESYDTKQRKRSRLSGMCLFRKGRLRSSMTRLCDDSRCKLAV